MNLKRLFILLLLVAGGSPLSATDFEISGEFLAYMKAVTNPHDFGRKDGRYHPYSTRYGRRIGYARAVTDKSLYTRGETRAEAEQHLRHALSTTALALEAWLARKHPDSPLDSLDPRAREILVDRAFTDGVENLPPAFCAAVLRADWATLLDEHLYVRAPEGWPDTTQNHAFGLRWIYGETGTPLRPLKKTTR
ncbi:MAG: hypothetical protein PSV13_05380 [Lacunisphaera sp.]|nr:hypothetical protein [Lacunisphaera sp.]